MNEWTECERCGAAIVDNALGHGVHMLQCEPFRALLNMVPFVRPSVARQLGGEFGRRIKSRIEETRQVPAPKPPPIYVPPSSEPPEE